MRWRRPRRDKEDLNKKMWPVGKVSQKQNTVTISPHEKPWMLFETTIHEGLHACYLDLDEVAVFEAASDITKLFRKMGLKISFHGEQS